MKKVLFVSLLFVISFTVNAQDVNKEEVRKEVIRVLDSINNANKEKQADKIKLESVEKTKESDKGKDSWYKKFSIRGYVQVRYNGLFSTNDKVSCDRSM